MCVFRKRGGAANTGPGSELHLTQFPAYISLSSRREAKPRFGSKPANDDRANLCPLYILIVLSPPLFANRRPETPLELFIFLRGPFSPIHSTLFPLSLSASPFLLFLSFVSNIGGENLVRRSVPPSIILLLLSPLPCVSIESF